MYSLPPDMNHLQGIILPATCRYSCITCTYRYAYVHIYIHVYYVCTCTSEHGFFNIFILTWRAYANYAEWLFSLRKRLRGDTFAIFCYSTDYADYAVDLACTTLYMKHTNYADFADKISLHVTTRDYARLRPAGPRLREHSCSFMAIIAPSCREKRCSSVPMYMRVHIYTGPYCTTQQL